DPITMIVIKVKNAREIVAKRKGRFLSKIAPWFVDVERRVEEEIVRQLQSVFAEQDIQAVIEVVKENSTQTDAG
ncbi:MAG: hypothetical protein KDI38_06785, partial [Calditrichaeota bacterium]|nr:hypothetical protein [Calditrichota bacterium]MCB0303465.1 hypothetical protein [Calditrichota bacterium]